MGKIDGNSAGLDRVLVLSDGVLVERRPVAV